MCCSSVDCATGQLAANIYPPLTTQAEAADVQHNQGEGAIAGPEMASQIQEKRKMKEDHRNSRPEGPMEPTGPGIYAFQTPSSTELVLLK